MFFGHSWSKNFHKQLHAYAYHNVPKNDRVTLGPHLFLLLAIQIISGVFGLSTPKAIPLPVLGILLIMTTVLSIVLYYREREKELVGFFRFISGFFLLMSFSIIELTIVLAISQAVTFALLISLFASLITFVIIINYIKKQIERGAYPKEEQHGQKIVPFLAAALGFLTHLLFRQFLPEKGEAAFIVVVTGCIASIMLGGAVMNWLKSIGAEKENK